MLAPRLVGTVNMDGANVDMVNRYPTLRYGIERAVQITGRVEQYNAVDIPPVDPQRLPGADMK